MNEQKSSSAWWKLFLALLPFLVVAKAIHNIRQSQRLAAERQAEADAEEAFKRQRMENVMRETLNRMAAEQSAPPEDPQERALGAITKTRTEFEALLLGPNKSDFELGTAGDAPSDEQLAGAEQALGFALPTSYRHFLRAYGGGSVFGDEISSIYPAPSTEQGKAAVPAGDLVFRYHRDLESKVLEKGQLPVLYTDFGEIFYLDANHPNGKEYPVMRKAGDESKPFAGNFWGFLWRLTRR